MAKTVLRRPLPVALLAGTVIVAGALTCTQGPANGSDLRRQAWADAPPSQAFALRALSKLLAKGWSSAMAALPDGYDAATWDQAGHIQFWEQAGALPWSRATSCKYPVLPGSGPPLIYSVTGKALGPGSGAAFIFVGAFTGDTSGDVVAFATTGTRWGPVTYSGGTSMPIGTCTPQGFALAQHRGEDFEGNGLVTVDAVTVGAYPEIDHWSWTGSEFALRTSDAFSSGVVRSVPAKPTVGSPCQPPQENLRRGVYDVYLQGEWGEGQLGATQVKALVGPRPGDWQCYIEIPIAAPLLLPASTHPGGTARAWISEPAWLLSHGGTPDGPELDGLSVPAGYRVTAGAGQPLASAGLGLGPPQPVHARISYADDVTPTIYVLPSQ